MSRVDTTRLGDVASFIRGITFKPNDVVPLGSSGSVACMRTKNVQAELDLSDVWGIPDSFVKRKDQFLELGDLLVSSANSWNLVGKCCWIPELPWRATFGGFISVLRSNKSRIAPRYLYHWFSSPRVQATVRSFGQRTTNISNLNVDRCQRLPVPLPSLPEQRRIAEVLDNADALRAKRRAALAQLDTLTQSIFLDMFGDPATNPKGWPVAPLERISLGGAEGLKRGPFGGTLKKEIFVASGYKVYEQQHAIHKDCSIGKYFVTEAKYLSMQSFAVKPGDFIVSCSGTVGQIFRLPLTAPKGVINQALLRIRIDGAKVLPAFFETLFESDAFQRSLLGGARGTGINNFPPMTQIRSLSAIVPPLSLQGDFVQRIAEVDGLGTTHRTSLHELDALFTSLQQRAFQGDL